MVFGGRRLELDSALEELGPTFAKLGQLPLLFEPGTRWHYSVSVDIQGRLVVTVQAPGDGKFDFFTLHDYCFEKGFTIYPGKMFGVETFRLCNLGLITEKDVQDFFVVAREAFREMGYSLPIAK